MNATHPTKYKRELRSFAPQQLEPTLDNLPAGWEVFELSPPVTAL